MEQAVVIEAAPEDTPWVGLPAGLGWDLDPELLDPAFIRDRVRQAGLVGMGGAGFPAAVKLSPKPGSEPDVVILNGAECEPSITSDHRLMLEQPERVVLGLRLFMRATGARRGIIGIEANKPDAAARLSQLVAGDPSIAVEVLPVRDPQGAEKMLVWALLRRAVPVGAIPLDVGVVVQNVATAAAAATALAEGRPLTDRIVTVSGRVQSPGNWRVPLGTSFVDLVRAAGGLTGSLARVIAGGPMMGMAQADLDVPVTKTTGSVILLGPEDLDETPAGPCIRCGRCVSACPMGLLPAQLCAAALNSDWAAAERFHVRACMECGSCSYVCPARRPIVQSIRLAKSELGRRARQGRG
jgi:electron transport complex protein RnfC